MFILKSSNEFKMIIFDLLYRDLHKDQDSQGTGVREARIPQNFSWNSSFFIEPVDWISILEKKFENSWKEVEKSSPPLSSSVDQLDGILGFPSSSPRLTLEFHLSLEDSQLSSQTGWRNSNFQSGFPNFAIRNSKSSSQEI